MEEVDKILKDIEEKIIKELEDYWNGQSVDYLTPALADNYRVILVAIFSRYSEELSEIEKRLPVVWSEIRKTCDSVKSADMIYSQTPDGQRKIELKYKLESIKKMISALRDRLSRMRDESYHQY